MQQAIGWTSFSFLLLGVSVQAEESSQGHWDLLTDVLYVERYHVKDQVLVLDPSETHCVDGCPSSRVLDTKDLVQDFGFEPGLHVSLSYVQNERSLYEGSFTYVWEFESTETVTSDTNSLVVPFSDPSFTRDFYAASKVTAHYESQFYTAEINYWKTFSASRYTLLSLSGVGGIRFANVAEEFSLTSYKGQNYGSYEISTKNDLIGIQLGFLLETNPIKHLHIDFVGKAGVGLNRIGAKVFLGDLNDTVQIRQFNQQSWQSNIFAEASGQVGYRASSWFDIHVGYEMLYFCGLGLAPDQIDTSSKVNSYHIQNNGYIIVYGVFGGFLFSF